MQDCAVRVWAEQIAPVGRRVFLTATADSMAARVQTALDAGQPLSVYEVLFKGYCVRPYFDLEYMKCMNPGRTHQQDCALLQCLIHTAQQLLPQLTLGATIDVASSVVLDSSNADKFSAHVILHIHNNCGFADVRDAQHFATRVVAALREDLKMAVDIHNRNINIIDLAVYHNNQQMRILHCVKYGDSRVLRPGFLGNTAPTFDDSLICVSTHQPVRLLSHSIAAHHRCVAHTDQSVTADSKCCASDVLPELCDVLKSVLHCSVTHVMLHRMRLHASPALFLHTTSTTCAYRQHQHNHAVVEIDCKVPAWRVLCRDQCPPGAWHTFAPDLLCVAASAPAWLQHHLQLHCMQS